jgi:hypothetical protein
LITRAARSPFRFDQFAPSTHGARFPARPFGRFQYRRGEAREQSANASSRDPALVPDRVAPAPHCVRDYSVTHLANILLQAAGAASRVGMNTRTFSRCEVARAARLRPSAMSAFGPHIRARRLELAVDMIERAGCRTVAYCDAHKGFPGSPLAGPSPSSAAPLCSGRHHDRSASQP